MKITHTGFDGLMIIEADVLSDSRGHFFESFNKEHFKTAGLSFDCVQINQSSSRRGVIRGLHFQRPPFEQAKLVRVLSGTILDVVVDLRPDQPTFKKVFAIELASAGTKQLLIPKGFAHGFSVISDGAVVNYLCDSYYKGEYEAGILFNDRMLSIDWKIPEREQIVSEKDKRLPELSGVSYKS